MHTPKTPLKLKKERRLLTVGWREWLSLPELGITRIKAKVDSGARTSALHAFEIKPFKLHEKHYIRFKIHPLQRSKEDIVECIAEVQDIRWITDSGGHRERRYVIKTLLKLGEAYWPIELTLTNRDTMSFRMLLGRTAMKKRLVVNPGASFLLR
ncbi:MAG TPA: RimK/LysX family protein [Gammaproteobacteria bacterium]|nr:RimK/LysX family protein [Gammaproteobacteria bacterium]